MIDTHCHLLPGLDDGPVTGADCVRLARTLSEEGATRVLCTPHWSRRYPTSVERARDRLERARSDLAGIGVPLHLELAAEVSVEFAVRARSEELVSRAIARRFVLVELISGLRPDAP